MANNIKFAAAIAVGMFLGGCASNPRSYSDSRPYAIATAKPSRAVGTKAVQPNPQPAESVQGAQPRPTIQHHEPNLDD